ncbi:MAG: hypothetical protein K6L75_05000 [Cellvibrionaceae bacterium]
MNDDYSYYDLEGFICRTTGTLLDGGSAEKYYPRVNPSWQTTHHFDLLEEGKPISKYAAVNALSNCYIDTA